MHTALAAIDGDIVASAILAWIGHALLFGTALAALTWLVSRILRRRIHPAIETALWSIVLIKFLIPAGPAWSIPMINLPEGLLRASPVHARMPALAPTRDLDQPDPRTALTMAPPPHSYGIAIKARSPWAWSTLLVTAYVAGTISLLGWRTHRHQLLLKRCRRMPLADHSVRRLVINVCQRLGVKRIPSIRIAEEFPAPFVMGFFRPWLVLPRRQLVRPNELETVVVHEVAHLRRGDLFVRYLQWIVGALLFFWPVVAWVNRRLDTAREYACDQWALRHGKLTAGQYARCLLDAVRPRGSSWLMCQTAGMAGSPSTIERRIDMILESPLRPSNRLQRTLLTIALLIGWGGFALTGGAAATPPDLDHQRAWPATEEGVRDHAIHVYNFVAEHQAADFNGDGILSYTEKNAYLVALAAQAPDAFLVEFPYADRNQSGKLDYLEAFGVIQAITRIAYLDRRISAEITAVPDPRSMAGQQQIAAIHTKYDPEAFGILHESLDAQEWLLENMTSAPSAGVLDNIWSVIKRIEGPPHSYSNRMLNHGGPPLPQGKKERPGGDLGRFPELEGQIAAIEAKLAVVQDQQEAARLRVMLDKLEGILATLQDS